MTAPGTNGNHTPQMDDKHQATQDAGIPKSLPFRAVLVPHRSLTPRGFFTLMAVLGVVSFAMGLAFAYVGAWPVLGFFGLDVAIIYLAFKLNYRAARATETIEVTRDDLTITQQDAHGKTCRITRLSPTWTRLEEHEAPDGSVALSLSLHGRRYGIAQHLNSDERRSFSRAIAAALRLVRDKD